MLFVKLTDTTEQPTANEHKAGLSKTHFWLQLAITKLIFPWILQERDGKLGSATALSEEIMR